jgi:hypothetical protein
VEQAEAVVVGLVEFVPEILVACGHVNELADDAH